jgi:hypothetical protein
VSDLDQEPVRGLPEELPAGERVLWQGAPDWRALAVEAFQVRKVAIWFAALIAVRFVIYLAEGEPVLGAALSAAWLLPMALTAIGLLALLAWYSARTTVYTVTDRRLVLRIGMALTMTINVPFRLVQSAGVVVRGGGTGTLTFTLDPSVKIAWALLWPHCRPWRLARPEPALRAIPDAGRVAELVAAALLADAARHPAAASPAVTPVPAAPEPQAAPAPQAGRYAGGRAALAS